jgi:hypothetical protein
VCVCVCQSSAAAAFVRFVSVRVIGRVLHKVCSQWSLSGSDFEDVLLMLLLLQVQKAIDERSIFHQRATCT